MLLGEIRAKRSQDDKPPTHRRLVRTASVDYAPWSRSSLRSRRGMKVSATRPLLSRLSFAPLIPARPFGLGLRFDQSPSGSASNSPFAPHVSNQAAKAMARYHSSEVTAT